VAAAPAAASPPTSKQAVSHGTIQFIAVGTPPDEDGSADLQPRAGRGAQHRPRT
jgi:hypothetical protein